MMQAAAATTPARKYANDGSYESVQAMLVKQATVFYPRVMALRLPMEFEDVLGILNEAYVKARKAWNPEKAQFNTYCYRVAQNHFNKSIERMVLDRQHLGLSSIDDQAQGHDDEEAGDGYSRYLSQEDEGSDPLQRMETLESVKERLARLSAPTRTLVAVLIRGEQSQEGPPVSLRQAARNLGLSQEQIAAVQVEITRVFGVTIPFGLRKKQPA